MTDIISILEKSYMLRHMAALLAGVVLDRIIGDPYDFPHPVRAIGSLVSFFEKKLLPQDGKVRDGNSDGRGGGPSDQGRVRNVKTSDGMAEVIKGALMWCAVAATTALITMLVMALSYRLHVFAGMCIEAVLTCYILAAKSLKDETMKVYDALEHGTIDDARHAVSMIVGRDTMSLDDAAVTRAAIETVSENTSDGVIAPLIYTFLGGPVIGLMYKAVNTMDSMVGYHSVKYEYFGKVPAIMDDIFNFLPARISAVFVILSSFICGKEFSGRDALRIFLRDRYKHKSPNSAQTESVCAGALGVRLAGPASYFGVVVNKPYIGDDKRPVTHEDIKRAIKLLYVSEALCMAVLLGIAIVFFLADKSIYFTI